MGCKDICKPGYTRTLASVIKVFGGFPNPLRYNENIDGGFDTRFNFDWPIQGDFLLDQISIFENINSCRGGVLD